MPITVIEAMPAKNTRPMLRSRTTSTRCPRVPKGMTIQLINPATATMSGAVLKIAASTARGVMCSF